MMTSEALIPALLGLGLGLVVIVTVLLIHRYRRRGRKVELPDRKRSATSESSTSKIFRSKSSLRSEIPQFVIPGTHLKLVQPVITPPSPPPTYRKTSSVKRPLLQEVDETKNETGNIRQRAHTASTTEYRRRISYEHATQFEPYKLPQATKTTVHRSSSLDLLSDPGVSTPPDSTHVIQGVSSSTPQKTRSRNASVSSIDLLSINVPPSTRSTTSSLEGSQDSSRQSPEDSPRLFRLFRQSKHQIKLTGASVEFSLQYQISKRALILNVMRVRSVFIPTDRKQDAKLCLSIHLKPDKFIWEANTKVVQGTENPIFGEVFTISGFSLTKLHDCALLFRLKDFNVNQTIGEVTFSLRDLQPDVLTSRACQLQRPITATKDKDRSYVGDILVSMDYDPTIWKLNVRIIRARSLPKMSRGGHTDAFVKVNVMQDLTRIYKRKTHVQRHEWNPEFDEGFDFELTRDQMDSASITLKVIHRGKIRDHLIGVTLLGFNVDPLETGYQHWAMVLDKPNLSIEQWHKIYPVLK